MNKSFKTKKLAQAHRRRLINKLVKKMCPIFNMEMCHGEKCMSFNNGRVYEQSYGNMNHDKWLVVEPCCGNATVTGYIEMQMVEP